MIPLKLEIEGFLSYRERQEIDFEELLKTKIFLIQGHTGAGKSSILDAIIFALYGKIPRFGDRTKKELFINHDSDIARVSFTFKMREPRKTEYTTYKITRVVGRGERMRVEIKYKTENGFIPYKSSVQGFHSHLRDKNEVIEKEIIGMPYKVFTKSVVLPQGKFMEFLTATASQKSEIIMNMTNIGEIIDAVGKLASEELREKKGRFTEMQRRLQEDFKDVSDERISALKKEKDKIKKLIEKQEKYKGDIEREIENLRNKEKDYENHINFLGSMLSDLSKAHSTIKEISDENEKLRSMEDELEKARGLSELMEQVYALMTREDGITKNTGELRFLQGEIAEVLNPLRNIKEYIKSISSKRGEMEESLKELQEAKINLKEIHKKLEEYGRSDPKVLEEVISIIQDILVVDKDIKKITDEKKKVLRDIEKAERILKENRENLKEKEDKRDSIRQEIDSLNLKINEINEKIEKLKIIAPAGVIRRKLKDGEMCPVCGSIFRKEKAPLIDDEEIKDELSHLEEEKSLLEKKLKNSLEEMREIERIIGTLQGMVQSKQNEISEKYKELKEKEKELSEREREREYLVSELRKYEDRVPELEEDPLADTPTDIFSEQFISELKKRKEEIEKLERKRIELGSKVEFLENTISFIENDISEVRKRLEEEISHVEEKQDIFQRIKTHISGIKDEAQKIRNEIQKKIAENGISDAILPNRNSILSPFEKMERACDERIGQAENINLQIRKINFISSGETEKNISDDVSSIIKIIENFKESVKRLCDGIDNFVKKFDNRRQEARERYDQKKEECDRVKNFLREKQGELKNILAEISAMGEELMKILDEKSRCEEDISQYRDRFSVYYYRGFEKLTSELDNTGKISAFLVELSEFLRKLEKLFTEKLDEIRKKIELRERERRGIEAELSELNTHLGKVEKDLEDMKRRIEEMKKLKRDTEELKEEINVLEIIHGDFSVSRKDISFKDFVMSYLLEGIVERASEILEELTGRYSFKIDSRGKDIKVVDKLYGELERDISGLSGGELFLASLSLSFALSSFLSSEKLSRIECFFIDEGFGSLDNDSIHTVINALEKLASHGIILGIISHVESMQNIGTFSRLTVWRDGKVSRVSIA